MSEYPDYITTKELAELLKVTEQTVKKWISQGEIKPSLRLPNGDSRFIFQEVVKQLSRKWGL